MAEQSEIDDFLAHVGVKGMKWGVRKDSSTSGKPSVAKRVGSAINDARKARDTEINRARTSIADTKQTHVDARKSYKAAKKTSGQAAAKKILRSARNTRINTWLLESDTASLSTSKEAADQVLASVGVTLMTQLMK